MIKDLKDITEDTSFEKTCSICKNLFERKPGISDKVWNARQCCSYRCSAISRRKPIEQTTRPQQTLKRRHNWEAADEM